MPITADNWKRVQALFAEAVERSPEDRSAFLDQACGGDAELRANVEFLLRHDSESGEDFLRPLVPSSARLPDTVLDGPDPLIGKSIGSCTIVRLINRGGMGAVYLAEQDHPRREVALKVMTAGAFTTRSALRRFEYESQILAKLRHPNIAQVYEAGTEEMSYRPSVFSFQPEALPQTIRLPYFVMEYIPDAVPITRYAREHRLDLRERLGLFLRICDAVHHGHQKGVIHRDLKPGNILVDSVGEPKVIDFGVAKSTDSDVAVTTLLTDGGQIIGTLQYMSPEQCAADPHAIDTRSDVYSLGVVLYEMLTERLPYDVSNIALHSAIRRVCEEAPTRPSKFERRLRGDLETITLKSLEKSREKRYQSATDLAADVRRYLAGEPVSAHPPTPWTRAMRWAARHPIATTAAACMAVAVTMLALFTITVWWYDRTPYDIQVSGHNREAALQTRSGKVLHLWGGSREDEIRFAELLKKPPGLGQGSYAIIGFSINSDSPYRGALCAFDTASDLDHPIWQHRIKEEDMPEELVKAGRGPNLMGVVSGSVADIFDGPDTPGTEIVVVFVAGNFSQCVIQVLDTKGNTLYQIWRDGSSGDFVCRPYWMKDSKLVVVAGGDEYLKFHGSPSWRSSDLPAVWAAQVVFAIRPELGFFPREFMSMPAPPGWQGRSAEPATSGESFTTTSQGAGELSKEGIRPGSTGLHPVWAKVLVAPWGCRKPVGVSRIDVPIMGNPGSSARLVIALFDGVESRSPAGTFGLTIDEDGEEVTSSRDPDDSYLAAQSRLPKTEDIKLIDIQDYLSGKYDE